MGLSPYGELNNFKKGKKVQVLQKHLESAEKEGPRELERIERKSEVQDLGLLD
jgi:hypothetical protein